ncbi:MAG TPA: DNA adenine methylase [Armatimonadota bacterium]
MVNVASVPQRSPFRYPGGKTWLIPHIRLWLRSLSPRPYELIEPFAGGAIVSLTAAFEGPVSQVTMAELDADVAAVWETILGTDGAWLAERIAAFDISPEAVAQELLSTSKELRERAFHTILRNRVNHGGILAPGSGVLKHGENGKGIASRWYPGTLKRRIYDILQVKERINFVHGDGLTLLRQQAQRSDAVFFIDPPYTAGGKRAGARLYTHSQLDHEELFSIAETLVGDFLMTYDEADDVRHLAAKYGFDVQRVPMKNTHHATMVELLIGRNLAWVR